MEPEAKIDPKERIIVALDTNNIDEAIELARQLNPYVGCFKIGLGFICTILNAVLSGTFFQASANLGKIWRLFELIKDKIFLDIKLHDIPNTAKLASMPISDLGVKMFNVHASGNKDMMASAVANKGDSKVLAVTVLTSISPEDCLKIYGYPIDAVVLKFARWAEDAGVDGIICSPQDLEFLNKQLGSAFDYLSGLLKVTPGIRSEWAARGDQKRVTTPDEAIRLGADYLVIGRPITDPPPEIGGPVEAAKKIAEEITEAFALREAF